jgi:streptogramin lyase
MARRLIAPFAAVLALLLLVAPVSAHPFPPRVDLPNGWSPEGITAGRGNLAYVGSLADGAIARVNLRSGDVSPLAAGAPGRVTVGVDYERGRHRIWAAGGAAGEVRAYDARSGALLQTYHLTTGFLNDVVVTQRAVYVTDSNLQQLVVVPLGRHGQLPDPSAAFVLPLTGDIQYVAGFNANGIVASRGWLILVQSNTGLLFRVNPRTGETREIDLGGASVSFGDGLEVVGSRLVVVRNQLNEVDVFRLGAHLGSARLVRTLTSPDLDVPTTVAFSAGRLWVVNARFNTPPTATTPYWITRLR